ncbi:hypothetical protein ACIGZJ_09710 [Kitasatospora sp. NPDC052868]|uniref:hypothetical protein n=1 Tax=Kitasatospora sp. NPDC052868 TaxID=3364060 RepID=UPI0037C84D82
MTTTENATTATGQLSAAGALLAILSAHTDLPTPAAGLHEFLKPGTGIPWGAWGVKLSLHGSLTEFEEWREALGLDPATADSGECDTTHWLTVYGISHGVPVEVNGFYHLPDGTGE